MADDENRNDWATYRVATWDAGRVTWNEWQTVEGKPIRVAFERGPDGKWVEVARSEIIDLAPSDTMLKSDV